jgi:zinc protease
MMNKMMLAFAILFFASLSLAQKEVPRPKDLPPYGAEKPLRAPSVKTAKLDNGLAVWLVSEPGFPKVAFTVAVRGGFAADPADRPGISELLSKTIDQGTKARTAKQIAQELQASGGDLSADSEKDFIEVSTAVLASRMDAGIAVLSDVLQNASFPDAEVALAKRNLSDSLRQRESEPSFLAARAMAKILFGDHPYHVTSPSQESIAAATATDLRRIFTQRFRPDQAILVAVGDFDDARMMEMVKAKFAAWKAPGESALSAPQRTSNAPEHAVFVVTRPGSVQTTLELGAFGPLRGDPDYEAAMVANAIYGGTFSSRLTANIREDKGYTYSPRSRLNAYQAAGVVVTHADVRNEVTAPTLNEIDYELNRLATTAPTDEELSKAKHYLVGREAIQLQARAALSDHLAGLWVDGLPPEEIGIYGQKITNTSVSEVETAAKRYFPACQTAIVAVGEEKVIREALAPFGIPVKTFQ